MESHLQVPRVYNVLKTVFSIHFNSFNTYWDFFLHAQTWSSASSHVIGFNAHNHSVKVEVGKEYNDTTDIPELVNELELKCKPHCVHVLCIWRRSNEGTITNSHLKL
jgi:hypothetical protein